MAALTDDGPDYTAEAVDDLRRHLRDELDRFRQIAELEDGQAAFKEQEAAQHRLRAEAARGKATALEWLIAKSPDSFA